MPAEFIIDKTTVLFDFSEIDADEIPVHSVPHDYKVVFCTEAELRNELKIIEEHNGQNHLLYVDERVKELYGDKFFNHETVSVKARESNKKLATAMNLVDHLQRKNFTKNEMLVSAGGGITQDITAFSRAVYKRGINWTYVPTTLLAMADSCIGAKSCLNYKGAKNQLGLFSAPVKVLSCDSFLQTLPYKDVLSGYGEIIKLTIVGGQTAIDKFLALKAEQNGNLFNQVNTFIKLALTVKKAVIQLDEFESGIRKALNYGHTVGHAVEPLANYKIPHGIAVSMGMIVENDIAAAYGALAKDEAAYLNNLIHPFIDNPSLQQLQKLSVADITGNMKKDKKNVNSDIYFSIPHNIGKFGKLMVKADEKLQQTLQASLNTLVTGGKN